MPVTVMDDESNETDEQIVMTPKSKTEKSTTIAIERRTKVEVTGDNGQMHVAGGNNTGIIVNKQISNGNIDTESLPPQMALEFKVFLINTTTKKHTLESRKLGFWFKNSFPITDRAKLCQEFFKELVSPTDFPRDYVGFIMKVMKILQIRYFGIKKVEIQLQQLEETDTPPERPSRRSGAVLITLNKYGYRKVSTDEGTGAGGQTELTEKKLLDMIENSYPNPLTLDSISKVTQSSEDEIKPHLTLLQNKGLIKALDNNAFTRVVQNETQVKIVKQMPKMKKAKQPTIAIITAQYCEKLAVDCMIENSETFVRYTTVGESNVYTLGNMGAHRVVSTKLPSVGHKREAMIAAGNTTTRLLGTFQKVDYVFLIGTGGGVPHFTDYDKHVRLGDVVVSTPSEHQKFVYLYCDKATEKATGGLEFETRGWIPTSLMLQDIAATIKDEGLEEWVHYTSEGLKQLQEQEADFERPPATSDKLYMAIGEKDVIEVAHPTPLSPKKSMESRVHLGPIASGRQVARDDHVRQELSTRLGILAYDSEFDSVLESVLGNRRESFIVVRGISDYSDGTRRRDWQPHAALLAAAFAKAIIMRMDPPDGDE